MTQKHLLPALVTLAVVALGACSSSSGAGSPPPKDVTVVVPPGSSVSP